MMQNEGLTHSSICVREHPRYFMAKYYWRCGHHFNPNMKSIPIQSFHSWKRRIKRPVVGRTIEDKQSNLWIGWRRRTLNFYNRRTREFKWYLPDKDATASPSNVKAFIMIPQRKSSDREPTLWIPTGTNWISAGTFTQYLEEGNPKLFRPLFVTLPYQIWIDCRYLKRCMPPFNSQTGKCQPLKIAKKGVK